MLINNELNLLPNTHHLTQDQISLSARRCEELTVMVVLLIIITMIISQSVKMFLSTVPKLVSVENVLLMKFKKSPKC